MWVVVSFVVEVFCVPQAFFGRLLLEACTWGPVGAAGSRRAVQTVEETAILLT